MREDTDPLKRAIASIKMHEPTYAVAWALVAVAHRLDNIGKLWRWLMFTLIIAVVVALICLFWNTKT